MISIVQGAPGAGKTSYAVEFLWSALGEGKQVYTNIKLAAWWPWMHVSRGWKRLAYTAEARYGKAVEVAKVKRRPLSEASEVAPEWELGWESGPYHYLDDVAQLPRTPAGEGTKLVVIDEAQLLFNCREWKKGGLQWLQWFSQSRKFGCDVLLLAQDHQMLDRQIRMLAEQLITCHSMARLSFPIPFVCAIPVGRWVTRLVGFLSYRKATMVGLKGLKLWQDMSAIPKEVCRLYDTTQILVG